MTKMAYIFYRNPSHSREEFVEVCRRIPESTDPAGTRDALHVPYPTDALRADTLGKEPMPAQCDAFYLRWNPDQPTALPVTMASAVERVQAYRVEEVIHWDRLGERRPGHTSPGVKMVAFVRRRPELSPGEFRERYLQHAAVAREHHPGIARYVQNFVHDAGGETPPSLDGIAELHFASPEDLAERFYRDETSPAAVGADVTRFLAPNLSWSILAEERVLR